MSAEHSGSRRSSGSEFQTVGPATENAEQQILSYQRGNNAKIFPSHKNYAGCINITESGFAGLSRTTHTHFNVSSGLFDRVDIEQVIFSYTFT